MARDETPSRRLRAAFFESPAAVVGIALFCLVLVVALAAPWISPQNPYECRAQLDALEAGCRRARRRVAGQRSGSVRTRKGRDVLSAILYGLRTSLAVGIA